MSDVFRHKSSAKSIHPLSQSLSGASYRRSGKIAKYYIAGLYYKRLEIDHCWCIILTTKLLLCYCWLQYYQEEVEKIYTLGH